MEHIFLQLTRTTIAHDFEVQKNSERIWAKLDGFSWINSQSFVVLSIFKLNKKRE